MKKKSFILVLFFLVNTFLFSKDSKDLVLFLRNNCNLWKDYERANNLKYYDSFNLYDNTYLVVGKSSNFFTLFITDGESFSRTPDTGTRTDTSDTEYKIDDLALFITDFDYDSNADLIGLCNDAGPGSTYLTIYSPARDEPLLEIEMPNYDLYEYKFSWINYCIVNGKRGIRIKVRGKPLEKKDYYKFVGDRDNYYFYQGENETLAFFYWSPVEQRYILDESVSQDQLKNADCPEYYFACNGLKFSKLDSKLTESDLKDLDKSQLRLMRNAVYARHGHTFKSVDLQSLWECYTWYERNPNYSADLLTETDKYNIELIQRFENIK